VEALEQAVAGAGVCGQLNHAYLLSGLGRDSGSSQGRGQGQLTGAEEQQGPAQNRAVAVATARHPRLAHLGGEHVGRSGQDPWRRLPGLVERQETIAGGRGDRLKRIVARAPGFVVDAPD
jgi:hypothetical protein